MPPFNATMCIRLRRYRSRCGLGASMPVGTTVTCRIIFMSFYQSISPSLECILALKIVFLEYSLLPGFLSICTSLGEVSRKQKRHLTNVSIHANRCIKETSGEIINIVYIPPSERDRADLSVPVHRNKPRCIRRLFHFDGRRIHCWA